VCFVYPSRTIGIPSVLAPVALPALVKGAIVLGQNLDGPRVRGLTTAPGTWAVDDEAATDKIGWYAGQFIRNNELPPWASVASWPGQSLAG